MPLFSFLRCNIYPLFVYFVLFISIATIMSDAGEKYECTNVGSCQPCADNELSLDFCLNGYKQPVTCQWNENVPKEHQNAHQLPKFIPCNMVSVNRSAFFRNQFIFVILGTIAFAVYLWRRRKLYAAYSSV
ncbi:hypothetical protein BX070DRAFT_228316 [Coemansia spiralis]|nr:hypothetical protein BX070DRAFT_228316 [Coemansia spiralis]